MLRPQGAFLHLSKALDGAGLALQYVLPLSSGETETYTHSQAGSHNTQKRIQKK